MKRPPKLLALVMLLMTMLSGAAAASAQDTALPSRLAPCPSFEQVLNRAITANGAHATLDALASARRRARLANLMPQVDVELGLDQRQQTITRYREDFEREQDGPFLRDLMRHDLDERRAHSQGVKLKLRFDLRRVVFDPYEAQLWRMERQERRSLDALIALVSKLYWTRRHHEIERLFVPEANLQARLKHTIEIERIGAQLNGLTAGWFNRQLNQGKQKP